MNQFIVFCIRRPVTAIMIIAALFLGGFVSFFSMPLDRLPEIMLPRVTVETVYPGMNARDIRSAVCLPLEDAMSPIKGLEGIHSISRDGVSLINLNFRWGTDPANAAALVREAVDRIYPGLPHGVNKPLVVSGNIGDEAHAVISIRSRIGDNYFARNLAEYEMKARFRRLDGAGAVILSGGEIREVRLKVNPERLVSGGHNGDELADLIASEIMDIPAGNIHEGDRELTVVNQGRAQSMEEFSRLIIPSASGPLDLYHLGSTVQEAAPLKSLFIYQNEEQCSLEIYRRPGADPVKLSRDIKKVISQGNEDFFRDAELSLVWDSSSSILAGIKNLLFSAAFAAAAVAFILALFIRHFHSGLFSALALPVSAAASLILLKMTGRSLNTMSLCGLAMGIGLVSDASVVVLDVFNRNLSALKKSTPEELGQLTGSVSGSSLAGTITTCIVFVPFVFLPGPLGALFGDLAVSLIASVAMGWLYAQFLLPVLFHYFYREGKKTASVQKRGPEQLYRPFLKKVIRNPRFFLAGVLIFSILGILLLLGRPVDFFVSEESAEIEVIIDFPPGTILEIAGIKAKEISRVLSENNSIARFYGRIGAEDEDTGRRADVFYRGERFLFRCFLNNGIKREDAIITIQESLSGYSNDGLPLTIRFPEDKTGKLLGFTSSYSIMVRGTSPEDTAVRSLSTVRSIKNRVGFCLDDINIRPSGTRPELRIIPNREALAYSGITAFKIAGTIYSITQGIVSGTLENEGRPMDIRIIGDIQDYFRENLEALPIVLSSREKGAHVFLGSLGKIERRESEAVLARQDRSDVLYLDLIPLPGKEKHLRAFFKKLPKDLFRADSSVFIRYQTALCITFALVIALLYLAMAAQFESFTLPLIIMLSILFALAGAGPMLWLNRSGLDSGSALGIIVLFGLTINNGIILYEAGEEKILLGFSPAWAVYMGALERFRPVLISSLTTVAGLVPLLFSPGASQRSMAAAMLGGLITSTALTVFAMPPVFITFFRLRRIKND